MESSALLVDRAKRFLEGHGSLMLNGEGQLVHSPATLYPSPIPQSGLDELRAIQPLFNELVDTVSRDHTFLCEVFENLHDEFQHRLYTIYLSVHKEGYVKPAILGIHRADYMLHFSAEARAERDAAATATDSTATTTSSSVCSGVKCPPYLECAGGDGSQSSVRPLPYLAKCPFKQIEINTIAASFGALAGRMPEYHRYMLGWIAGTSNEDLKRSLPENNVMANLAKAIAAAWTVYGETKAVVILLSHASETNIFDQNPLENALMLNHGIRMIRASLPDLIQRGRLDEATRRYYIDNTEVAVVYMRTCYVPELITTDEEWAVRLALERARCVVCPTIPYQLVGAKKIQQVLAHPDILSRFVPDESKAAQMQAVFAKLWSLDLGEEGDKAAALALTDPSRYVMKPQREGGGHNLYDDDIREALQRLDGDPSRGAYILMERILPPTYTNYLVTSKCSSVDTRPVSAASELGVYGVYVRSVDCDKVELNATGGVLLRTKAADSNEGGVIIGAACLDSPWLV
eukprot:scpid56865/ scgid31642/ Glutathione synthetase; Glutathione synthase